MLPCATVAGSRRMFVSRVRSAVATCLLSCGQCFVPFASAIARGKVDSRSGDHAGTQRTARAYPAADGRLRARLCIDFEMFMILIAAGFDPPKGAVTCESGFLPSRSLLVWNRSGARQRQV